MINSNLKNLLTEYEIKRKQKIKDLEKRKTDLYIKISRLKEIEDELNSISISTVKSILDKNNNSFIKDLKIAFSKLKKERNIILNKLGKDETYLKPFYDCNLCKDTGYVLKKSSTKMCPCLKQKLFDITYNKSNVGNLDRENFKTFNLNLYSDKVDKEKYSSNISPRENIKIIKSAVIDFIENFDIKTQNLLFTGSPGLGKTFMINCIVSELLKLGKIVLYQSAPVMFDEIINCIFSKNSNNENFISNLLNVDLLIIDDLGTETMNSLKFTELYKIINTRLLNQNKITKTIISTNLSLQELYNAYDERLISRFVGHYDSYLFFGDDIRFKKKNII